MTRKKVHVTAISPVCIIHYLCTDRDRLFYIVYEKSSIPSSSLLPHLWTYRSRITPEHLFQTLQAQKMKDSCPILHEFLKEVSETVLCWPLLCHSLVRSPYCEPHVIFLNWYNYRNRCLISVIDD